MQNILDNLRKKDIFLRNKNYEYKGKFKSSNSFKLLFKVWKKISKRRKFQFFILVFLIIINGFIEFLVLNSIIPFINAITNTNNLSNYRIINNLYNNLGFINNGQIIFLTTFIFLILIFSSAILRILNLLLNFRLTAAIGSELSSECYRKTLYQPYSKHVNSNSSVLITIILKDINTTVKSLSQFLIIVNSSIIAFSIFIGLLIANTKIAILITIIFVTCYVLIGYKNRISIEKNSYVIVSKSQKRTQALQEGLGAIKEILLGGNQNYYTEIYKKTDLPIRKLTARNKFLGTYPKFLLETLGITIIAIIGAYISSNGNFSEAIALIGLIALGSQRLLPSLQTVYTSWIDLKSSTAAILNVSNLLDQKIKPIVTISKNFNFKNKIEFKNVGFRYAKGKSLVIKNLNFEINFGDKIGIIGKTGSGKSTTIDLLMTLIEPSIGKILIDGRDVFSKNSKYLKHQWRTKITHVPQLTYLADSSFYENIAFGEDYENINFLKVKQAARKAKLSEFIESFPNGYNTNVGERGIRLSGGQRQRISLARAFYRDLKIFILDEATSALDSKTEKEVIESIYNLGSETTVIMIAHRLTTLKNCDKIIKFENGTIIKIGSPGEIL